MTDRSQRLYRRARKILKWTLRAKEASTRKEARKALRKVAKHSLKLAKCQGRAYAMDNQEEES